MHTGLGLIFNTVDFVKSTYRVKPTPSQNSLWHFLPIFVPLSIEAPKQPEPIAAVVVQPKVETAEEKLLKQQEAFEKFMDKFSVPIHFVEQSQESLNKGELSKEDVRERVLNSKGWNAFSI